MNTITRIGDLITALQECDPDGTITISLDGALIFDDETLSEVEYSFDPVVEILSSKYEAKRSDRVHFGLSNKDTEGLVSDRRNHVEAEWEAASTSSDMGVVTDAPVAIALAFDREAYTNLLAVVANCNLAEKNNQGATTHGSLDVPKLLLMLAEDAAMTNTRPGSWEGANMQQVLDSHGYQ
ncbi:hypothetical protein HH212_24750 [Massilia forsythiae]|uniref:Uncharacterized protein n=1 Tax=Massilia forsythiae TaxID=2728020 RepID=A0A7Z2W155_9BURK|nr:hypothetical protein [Massilia forsythiae]QJE02819.1 hypothetical protein HH212_24750 [Massilia forsythiae]